MSAEIDGFTDTVKRWLAEQRRRHRMRALRGSTAHRPLTIYAAQTWREEARERKLMEQATAAAQSAGKRYNRKRA